MNLHKRFALSLALVTLLGLTAVGASADTVSKGTFTLSEQAYWGDTLLPAGEYTVVLAKGTWGTDTISLRGEGVSTIMLAPAGYQASSGRGCLKLDEINGTLVVRELDDTVFGRTYKFGVSKAAKESTLRGSARPVTVPISTGAGMPGADVR